MRSIKHHQFSQRLKMKTKQTLLLLIPMLLINFSVYVYAQDDQQTETNQLTEMSLEDLLNIDVSVASQKSELLSNTPAIVTSIKMDDMKSFGVRTLKDALAHIPGVIIQDSPVGSVSIMIRGLSETFNQKVLFLLEGVPYWMSSHGDIPLLSISVDMIDKIEVIRGPGSVIYGTNATAGVINVILKKNIDQTEVSLSGGSFGLLDVGANLIRKTDDGTYYIGGSVQKMSSGYDAFYPKTNLIFPFTVGKQIVGNDTLAYPTSGTVKKKDESYNFFAGMKYKNLNVFGHVFKQTFNGLGGAPLIFQTNKLIYQGFLLHADYSQKVADIDLNVYADYNPMFLTFDIDNFVATKNANNIVSSFSGKQEYKNPFANNFRLRGGFSATYYFTNDFNLLFGIETETRKAGEYQKTDAADNLLAMQSHPTSVNESSSFAQFDYTAGAMRFVAGARFVTNTLAGSHISPRASFIYNIDHSTSFKLLYSEGFNSPVLSQQDLLIPFVISGNKDLKAEIIRSVDLAFTSSTNTQILIVNGYYYSTSDAINRVTPVGAAQPQYTNVEGFKRYGIEVDYQKSLGKILLVSNLTYNVQGNKILTDDVLAQYVPAITFNVGARYKLVENHFVGISERFWSKRGGIEAQSITNISYNFSLNQFDFFLNAENIFNQNIQNPDVNAFVIPSVPGGPGRGFCAGVNVKF